MVGWAAITQSKAKAASCIVKSWLGKRKATKRELLSLIGKLSFAAKLVPAGRLFLHHLIQLSATERKLHHHIYLNPEARANLRWWNSFLPSWNGISMFIAPEWKDADSFQLYTDASGSFGFGAYLDGAWFRGDWQPHQQLLKRSIQWQELFAIVAAALTWGHLLHGWTAHQVSLRQPAHSPGMDQPVFKAPWHNGSPKNPVLYCSQKQLYSFPGAPPRQTELQCGLAFLQSNVTLLFPCPPGQPAAHVRTSEAGRALEGRLRHLLHRAVAPSTSTTYRAGIRKYYAFCTHFNLTPLPGSKHTIHLFAAYFSQVLQANTIQVYLAAVTHLHLTRGFSSPAHNNPTLNLAIRGMQRSQAQPTSDPRDCLSPLGCWSNC